MSKEPELLVLLIQKEVAERICATGRQSTGKTSKGSKGGKMSILAVAVQVFGAPQLVQEVPRESFWPTPEVDSAILKIIPHPDPILEKEEEKAFFRLVKMGFSSPRKQLINNLKAGLSVARPELEVIFQELDLHSQIRPGELTVEDWKNLSRKLRIGDNN
jgi:16S rRNA (adenine1518-N6/adenine1519-N6)-dimethyltransferase